MHTILASRSRRAPDRQWQGEQWARGTRTTSAAALARRTIAVAGQGSERALAAAAHGAIAFGFVGIGFILSLVITAVIWLTSLKSSYVREQSDRAGRYQIFVLLVNILAVALWALGFGLLLWLTGWRLFGFGGGDPQVARSLPITLVIILDSSPDHHGPHLPRLVLRLDHLRRLRRGPRARRARLPLSPAPLVPAQAPAQATPAAKATAQGDDSGAAAREDDAPVVTDEALDRKLKWD